MSRVHPDHPRCRNATWICVRGHTNDVIIYSMFHRLGVYGPKGSKFALPFPIALVIGFYNSVYYRTSRDTVIHTHPFTDQREIWHRRVKL